MNDQLSVLLVFVAVFAGIISEKLDKVLIVLFGALLLIFTGFIDFHAAIHAIDFNTICLLLGMMLLVEALREVKIFEWIALEIGIFTKGDPVKVFLLFGLATAIFSAFLDNVTTVLIMVPLIISLANSIGLEPKIFILSLVFFSNIGGAATLIGDPPNILIGTQVKSLKFMDFIYFLTPPVVVTCTIIFWYLRKTKSKIIKSRNKDFPWLFLSSLALEQIKREKANLEIPKSVLIKASLIFGLVLLGFFSHAITHLEPAIVALAGAVLMLIVFHRRLNLHHLITHVEWPTLLFFAGLFIIVGAMEEVGLLETISHGLVNLTDNLWVLLMIILWASAILSGLVDNIPFVAVMIPVLKELIKQEPFASDSKSYLLWWALALGACFGGNATMIGASANVVSVAIARSRGIIIGFKEFAKEALPVTVISILISSIYISILYLW
ncbi:MAG: ArsB/NhaD family transporter [Bdellovibrionales bacterium]|nr:ArsB/NhaD family transporter [Bdellovibrionales bacterium]